MSPFATLVKASAVILVLVGIGRAESIVPCQVTDPIQGPVLCLASGDAFFTVLPGVDGTISSPDFLNVNGWLVLPFGGSSSPDVPSDPQLGSALFLGFLAVCPGNDAGDCTEDPLHLFLSDTGFTTSIAPGVFEADFQVDQLVPGSTTLSAWYDTSGELFGRQLLIGTATGATSGSSFFGGDAGPNPYSLTLEGLVVAAPDGTAVQAGGLIAASDAPEPGGMVLFGTSLILLLASTGLRRSSASRSR